MKPLYRIFINKLNSEFCTNKALLLYDHRLTVVYRVWNGNIIYSFRAGFNICLGTMKYEIAKSVPTNKYLSDKIQNNLVDTFSKT